MYACNLGRFLTLAQTAWPGPMATPGMVEPFQGVVPVVRPPLVRGPEFLAGWVGGAFGVVMSHPFDVLRVNVQVSGKARTLPDVARRMVGREGLLSAYKGVMSPLVMVGVWKATVFSAYTTSLYWFFEKESTAASIWQIAVASSTGGAVGAMVAAPMEIVKCTAQVRKLKPGAEGSIFKQEARIARHIVRDHGVSGLYRGGALLGIAGASSFPVWFCMHEAIMRWRAEAHGGSRRAVPLYEQVVSGCISGACSWVVCYPLDKIKAMWQTDFRHKSLRAMLRPRVAAEGWWSTLYRGLGASVLRGLPQGGATMIGYEMTMRHLFGSDH